MTLIAEIISGHDCLLADSACASLQRERTKTYSQKWGDEFALSGLTVAKVDSNDYVN
jgi:hypothetical protein